MPAILLPTPRVFRPPYGPAKRAAETQQGSDDWRENKLLDGFESKHYNLCSWNLSSTSAEATAATFPLWTILPNNPESFYLADSTQWSTIANCMIIVWLLTWCLQIRCLSKGLGFQITLQIVRPLSSKGITWTWNNLYLVPPIPHSGIKCVIPFISGRFLRQSPIVLLIVSIAHRLVLIDFCPV